MSDEARDPRWGYDDLGQKERGWTVDERDRFVQSMREVGANWAHHDGRMQSVWLDAARVHITFGDRPEDRARVWAESFDRDGNRLAGPSWVNGGPAAWLLAIFGDFQ